MKTSRVRPAFVVAVSAMSAGCQETPHRNPPALPVAETASASASTSSSADAAPSSATCPAKIEEAEACTTEGQVCDPHGGCGFNGWRCQAGKWKKLMKYCNPPPPKQGVTVE